MKFSFHSPMECFLPKMLQTVNLYNWGLVQTQEIGPKVLEYFILGESDRILNYEQKFRNTIKNNP